VRLCDFGLVVVGDATDARLTTTAHANGTAAWMSPQRLTGTRYRITEADDVYAYACLCYYVSAQLACTPSFLGISQLSTGHAPFHKLSQTAAMLKIINDQRPPRPNDGDAFRLQLITDALWDMVQKCWAPDAAERPTAAHIVSELAAMTFRVIAEDEENLSLVSLRRRHQPGVEPDDEPARKRSRMLQLEVPSGQERHRSLGIAVAVESPSTAISCPKIGTISASSAFEASWLARTEARVRAFYWNSRTGYVTLCLWHRLSGPVHRQNTLGFLSCGCTYEEALFEDSLVRNGVGTPVSGETLFLVPPRWAPKLRDPLLGLLQERYDYRDGDFERDPITGLWKDGEGPLHWEHRQLVTQTDIDAAGMMRIKSLKFAHVVAKNQGLAQEPYAANARPSVPQAQTEAPTEASWRARTEARVRQFCSMNSSGYRTCVSGHEEHRSFVYPPRAAPAGKLNCGCTYEEALFEESLARNGVGAYHPGESVRMEPALRNPLLRLLEERYGYRDGDFERDPITGGWKNGEASWENIGAADSDRDTVAAQDENPGLAFVLDAADTASSTVASPHAAHERPMSSMLHPTYAPTQHDAPDSPERL
jgi:hypothetical protein